MIYLGSEPLTKPEVAEKIAASSTIARSRPLPIDAIDNFYRLTPRLLTIILGLDRIWERPNVFPERPPQINN